MAVKHQRETLKTPRGLLSALQEVFPDFGDAELIREIETGEANLHTVMIDSCGSFGRTAATDRQLTSLANLVAQSVQTDDLLENAVGTCLLEALGRNNRLWKFLPANVKAYIRAH